MSKQADKLEIAEQLKLERQLCFALYSTSRAITKQYAPILQKLGLTYPQYLAMMVLWQGDGIQVQELAKALELEQPTTTPLVQRLEKLGLVTRQRSTQDERKLHVFLTDKGKALHDQALTVPSQIACAVGVDEATATRLITDLNQIKTTMSGNKG